MFAAAAGLTDVADDMVGDLLERCTFPEPGSAIDCAVSGGADSMAMLVLGVAAGCRVTAHHVDHALRPESAGEADLVAATAAQLGAAFQPHRVEVAPGPNLEARARAARFAALPSPISTGHTLDDRAETVLINLVRGAGRTGLSPMARSPRHPIVGLRRHETRRLCEALGLDVVDDPMNNDPRFLRNRMRHEVLPLLDEVAERDVAAVIDAQADIFADEDRFLDELATAIDVTDAPTLARSPVVLARRAIRNWVREEWGLSHPPGGASVERILQVAHGSAVSCEIEGGHRVHRTAQKLRLQPPSVV